MSDGSEPTGIVLLFLFIIIFIIGVFIGDRISNMSILEDCQQKYNVYQCEVIAVPKKKGSL